jgi:hypothetical protein
MVIAATSVILSILLCSFCELSVAAAGPIAHADWFVCLFVCLFVCETERVHQLLKIMETAFGQ